MKYVCLGDRLNFKDKLSKIFYKLKDKNTIDENDYLLFSEGKKRIYFFGRVYDLSKDELGYSIDISNELFESEEVLKIYLIKSDESQQLYYKLKSSEKTRKEMLKLEKENFNLDNLNFGDLRQFVMTKKISVNTFQNIVSKYLVEVELRYYKK